MRASITDTEKRVVLPDAYLVVFETNFDDTEGEAEIEHARKQLSPIRLKVEE
jgi:hypothetical protein